jgi:hypothetical protein
MQVVLEDVAAAGEIFRESSHGCAGIFYALT